MRGNKTKAGTGKWRLKVYVGRVEGKTHFHNETFHGTAREADERLGALITQHRQQGLATGSTTVAQLVDAWYAEKVPELQPKTAEDYWKIIVGHLHGSALGTMVANKVRVSHVAAFFKALPSTELARKAKTILNQSYVYGVVEEHVVANPVRDAPLPKTRNVRIAGPAQAPDVDDLLTVIRCAYSIDHQFGVLLSVAATTGARTGEIAGWQIGDYNPKARTLTVKRAIDRYTDEPKVPKSDAGVREIPLNDETCGLLDRYLARRAAKGDPLGPASWLFVGKVGAHLRPDGIASRLDRICTQAGVTVKMHGIRSFVITHMLANGVDPVTVARIAGHSNVSQSFGYARGVRAVERAAVETLPPIATPLRSGVF